MLTPGALQLLALNDFHGNLEPPTGSGGRIQPGSEDLSTQLARLADGLTSRPR